MNYSLVLTFKTTGGENVNLTIDNVKPLLTDNEVDALMNTLLSKNIFFTGKGSYAAKVGASLKQNKTSKFNIGLV